MRNISGLTETEQSICSATLWADFIKVEVSDEQRAAVEQGYRHHTRHAFRVRCQMVSLKSEGRKSTKIAGVVLENAEAHGVRE